MTAREIEKRGSRRKILDSAEEGEILRSIRWLWDRDYLQVVTPATHPFNFDLGETALALLRGIKSGDAHADRQKATLEKLRENLGELYVIEDSGQGKRVAVMPYVYDGDEITDAPDLEEAWWVWASGTKRRATRDDVQQLITEKARKS